MIRMICAAPGATMPGHTKIQRSDGVDVARRAIDGMAASALRTKATASIATAPAYGRRRGSGRSERTSSSARTSLPPAPRTGRPARFRLFRWRAGRSRQKIIADHLAGETEEEIELRVDQILLEDATGTMACLQFEPLGLDRVALPTVSYVDHNVLQFDNKNPEDHAYLRSWAARYGALYSRPGNGIAHYLHLERFARPGQVLLGADSHTTMAGALGMLAIGAGATEVAVAMAGRPYPVERPLVVGVELRGRLRPWVQSKDVVLELLRRRGVRGGRGRIFEFHGEGVAALSATDRGTICNMVMETGATTGIFPSDEQTRAWLAAQGREDQFVELAADDGAEYDETEEIDLGELEPLIALPSSPGNVVPVREAEGTGTRQVCVGSSVNSSYEDLALVAAVLRGRSLPAELDLTVTPGSRQILDMIVRSGVYGDLLAAGARILEPACGPCIGMGQAPAAGAVSVRTFNRNFPGRSGTPDDQVYLCSPATAAATALRGEIADPRELGERAGADAAAAEPGRGRPPDRRRRRATAPESSSRRAATSSRRRTRSRLPSRSRAAS